MLQSQHHPAPVSSSPVSSSQVCCYHSIIQSLLVCTRGAKASPVLWNCMRSSTRSTLRGMPLEEGPRAPPTTATPRRSPPAEAPRTDGETMRACVSARRRDPGCSQQAESCYVCHRLREQVSCLREPVQWTALQCLLRQSVSCGRTPKCELARPLGASLGQAGPVWPRSPARRGCSQR